MKRSTSLAVRRCLPSGAKAKATTWPPLSPARVIARSPVSTFQILTSASPALPEASHLPSGLKARPATPRACPPNTRPFPEGTSHSVTVLSMLVEASRRPSGLKAILRRAFTGPAAKFRSSCPVATSPAAKFKISCPVATSTSPILGWKPPGECDRPSAANQRPSGLKAIASPRLVRVVRVRSFPVATSQTPRGEATAAPSGLKANARYPDRAGITRTSRPVLTSHSRTVLSRPPAASKRPSGLKAIAVTNSVCPVCSTSSGMERAFVEAGEACSGNCLFDCCRSLLCDHRRPTRSAVVQNIKEAGRMP
jgi:hypothetical protein